MKNEPKTNAVRMWDVISTEHNIDNAKSFPMYEIVDSAKGIVKVNAGTKRDMDTVVFYDVSDASEEFKEKYAPIIYSMNIRQVLPLGRQKDDTPVSVKATRIETFLSVSGDVYGSLSKEELACIGDDFCSIESTPEGIKVEPVIIMKHNTEYDLYVRLHYKNIPADLADKIASEVHELSQKENGLYEVKDSVRVAKEL